MFLGEDSRFQRRMGLNRDLETVLLPKAEAWNKRGHWIAFPDF